MRLSLSIVPSFFAMLILAVGMGGCSSSPSRDAADAASAARQTPSTSRETTTRAVESTRPTYGGPWEDPSSPLYSRTIYFDYDSAEIKPEYLELMRTHSRYLGTHTDIQVTLEGNTDERGTREYNLALADQRAQAVRRFMVAEGVLPKQLNTLSYGEERPADPGHGEQSWRLNRRVIIQY